MKNKKNIYFLVPTVLFIWGIIGYRIIKTINPAPKTIVTTNIAVHFKPNKVNATVPYTINPNYRDPFLGKITSPKKKTKKVATKPRVTKKEVVFPKIIYKGVVSPKTAKNPPIFLVQINGEQNLLKLKGEAQQVSLISGNEKEVVLEYKRKRQTFSIQK